MMSFLRQAAGYMHTQDLIRFAEVECQLILVHKLAVLLGTLRPHFGYYVSMTEKKKKSMEDL